MTDIAWAGASNPELRDKMAAWCFDQIGQSVQQYFESCVCLGVVRDGAPIGCVVFNDYNPEAGTIELTMAATKRNWVSKTILEEIRRYCFDELSLQMILARTKADNRHIRRILKSYGFDEYVIPRLMGRKTDGVIMTLTQEQSEFSKIGKRCRR